MEENGWVVEYLPSGHASDLRKESVVQLIGVQAFTLLEASVKTNANINIGQKLYVGKGERSEVERIRRRITYEDLTNSGKDFLPNVLRKAVEEREADFMRFINNAKPISIRVHTLDLLPGVGKKNMELMLAEREKKKFENFQDLKARVPTLGDPIGVFVSRIVSELHGVEKHYLFVRPPAEIQRQHFGRRY
ncbi:DUF655 domain-containing protein [Candidatus Micrarchaeota archaeon]|nr:DUF655 domain-containing protein [Candidatus Micrarchaeota archaeon]